MKKIGVHLSISGGPYHAIEQAAKMKIDAVQIFLKNSNRWNAEPYTSDDIKKFLSLKEKHPELGIYAHSGYLINLAGGGENYKKSVSLLHDELSRADLLDIEYLVLHPGSHKGIGVDRGIKQIALSLNKIYSQGNYRVKILLETTAGQGTAIGHQLEHLQAIIDIVDYKDKIEICLDTCHIFAAGYDITHEKLYNSFILNFDDIIGLNKLKLIHLNDSKKSCGSHVDRHEHIGKGEIGLKGFSCIINDERLENIPFILETPKEDGYNADMMNIQCIKNLIV